MIYGTDILTTIIPLLLFAIVSIIFTLFSPFGILFAVFSVIRGKTESSGLRKVSLFFQIFFAGLSLVIGVLVGILFSIRNSPLYTGYNSWIITLSIILGAAFVFMLYLGIIIWQSYGLREK